MEKLDICSIPTVGWITMIIIAILITVIIFFILAFLFKVLSKIQNDFHQIS